MKLTIDKKVCVFISLLIFALGATLGFYFIRTQTRLLNHGLDDLARHCLNDMAGELEYPVLVRDLETIARKAGSVLREEDIVFCRVEGEKGTVLFQAGRKDRDPFREISAPITTRKTSATEALILSVPQEKTEEIGKLVLAVSLRDLNEKIQEMERTVTTVVVLAVVIASLATYFLLQFLIGAPVALLVQATERIAAGDLSHKVSLETGDEFGILGDSFDRMTDSLLDAQHELVRREKLAILGQLAEGVGNELRNPLGVMRNAVFFLMNVLPELDKRVREYLDIINCEIDNSQLIISHFIDFFRTRKPKMRSVSVYEFVTLSVELSAIPDVISFRVDVPEDLPRVSVDPSQMQQALRNLVVNAVHAMPQGGDLCLTARKVPGGLVPNGEASGDFVEICITDTGVGISPEDMTRLFQPLFTNKSRGIGLGLAISQKLTEANGGRITVESELGKGTIVRVMLPVERSET